MGCSCSEPCFAIGTVTYILERIASCCAMTAVISCIVTTLTIMLGVGVGLGYNYCFVDMKLARSILCQIFSEQRCNIKMGMVLSVVSNLLYFSEKITVCLASTALVCCIIITIILVLCFGIGLGYNYCYVSRQPSYRDVMYVSSRSARPQWQGSGRRHKTDFKGFDYEIFRRSNDSMDVSPSQTTSEETESINTTESTSSETLPTNSPSTMTTIQREEYGPPTMIIPINGLDLIALLSRLRAENRNYSLQIVTT